MVGQSWRLPDDFLVPRFLKSLWILQVAHFQG